ncbi:MAG: PilZ domain-containing protein [Desulfobulbus sp.]
MPESRSHVKARADIRKNRLHLTIAGKADKRLLEQLYTEIRFCVADLKPGFEVIHDISRCQLIYIGGLPTFQKIIHFLLANKAGEIVRIVESDKISCKQILSFSENLHCYQPLYVNTPQEAEQRLETISPRNGIRLKLNHLLLEYDSTAGKGTASIVDISTSGCAVDKATLPLPPDMEFEGSIVLVPHPPLISAIQLRARVVRASATGFAATFLGRTEEFCEQFYQRLVYEASRADIKNS